MNTLEAGSCKRTPHNPETLKFMFNLLNSKSSTEKHKYHLARTQGKF